MKKIFLLFFFTSLVFSQKQNYLSIEGKITGFSDGTKVIISDMYNYFDIDSSTVINNKFKIKFRLSEPILLRLKIYEYEKWYNNITFYSELNNNIEITIDKENLKNFEIRNSELNSDYTNFKSITKGIIKKRDSIFSEIQQIKTEGKWDTIIRKKYRGKNGILDKLEEEELATKKKYLLENHKSSFCLYYIVSFFISNLEKEELNSFYQKLNKNNKNGKYGKFIKSYLDTKVLEIGNSLSELTGEDFNGNPVNLDSLIKNKLTLLAFETPYCQYCTKANPEIKKLVTKYNLNVVTFFIDTDKLSQKDYYKENNLNWDCVWNKEMKFNKELIPYQVEGTPKFFLISKEGKIVKIINSYDEDNFYNEVVKLINE
jgi:peroxiredoxin